MNSATCIVAVDASLKDDPGGGNLSMVRAELGKGGTVKNIWVFHQCGLYCRALDSLSVTSKIGTTIKTRENNS